ncbi:FAD-dependent monooxygenase yanF [Paramyrothecium foliicola]|nr:FAD-dependent monooxygenase yanF [Paramyrothecium foliicola]
MASTKEHVLASIREAGLSDVLSLPSDPLYEQSVDSYWSSSAKLRPWAIVQPRNTDEVSQVVRAIVAVPDAHFAIRSGGHMSSPGSNNIVDGITLDLSNLKEITFNSATQLASVQPGARWNDVYPVIESLGLMVTGGNIGDVGVGGYLLGGGFSYFSCRTGLACASVARYEVVLADGSVVEADKDNHAELFRALKGGSNNFGIVTRFDLETFENNGIWGGFSLYPDEAGPALIKSYTEYMQHVNDTSNGVFMLFRTCASDNDDATWMTILVNVDGTPNERMFAKALEVPANFTNIGATKMSTLVRDIKIPPAKHTRNSTSWRTLTFKYDERMMQKMHELSVHINKSLKEQNLPGNFWIQFVAQPVLAVVIAHTKAKGAADTLGLSDVVHDSINLLIMAEFDTLELQQAGEALMKEGLDSLAKLADSIGARTDWLYLNYSHTDQDPVASYGNTSVNWLKKVSAEYDPTGMFQKRVPGGFKLPLR